MDRQKEWSSALEHTLLDAICDASSAAILVVDADDLLVYASPQVIVFCDVPDFYLKPGTRLRDFLGAVYDHCLRASHAAPLSSREVWLADRVAAHWRERLDVSDYTFRKRVLRSVVRRLPSGLGICVLTDVTEQKKREENWRIDAERIKVTESILDSLPHPLVVMDEQLRIAATNKAFAAMVERREDTLAELPASAVFDASFVSRLQKAVAELQGETDSIAIAGSDSSDAGSQQALSAHVYRVGKTGRSFLAIAFTAIAPPPGEHARPVLPHRETAARRAPASPVSSAAKPRPDTVVIVTNDTVFETRALQALQALTTDHCVVRNASELQALFDLVASIDIRIDLTVIDSAMPKSLASIAERNTRSVVVIDHQHVSETLGQRLQSPAKVRLRKDLAVPMDAPARSEAQTPERLSILVVEDNEVNQIVFSQILDGLGCRYHVAANAADAMAVWQKENPPMVLMDISLPDMNGMDLCRLMRREEENGSQTRSVIVGVLVPAFDHDRPRCLEAGMDDVIVKPLSPDMIEQLLHRHFGERWTRPAHRLLQ